MTMMMDSKNFSLTTQGAHGTILIDPNERTEMTRNDNRRTLHTLQTCLDSIGLPQDQIERILTSARQTMLTEMRAWEAQVVVKKIRQTEMVLDNAKVCLAQIERGFRNKALNETEAVEKIIQVQQGLDVF